jgi:hypothetical protein
MYCFRENSNFPFSNQKIITLVNLINHWDKGNNKITELRTILQRESQNSYLYAKIEVGVN